jgi:hypothetical protein
MGSTPLARDHSQIRSKDNNKAKSNASPSRKRQIDSRLEGGGVNRAKLKFTNINTTTSRVSVRNINESAREGAKQIASK